MLPCTLALLFHCVDFYQSGSCALISINNHGQNASQERPSLSSRVTPLPSP
jgi:hypothetical protein